VDCPNYSFSPNRNFHFFRLKEKESCNPLGKICIELFSKESTAQQGQRSRSMAGKRKRWGVSKVRPNKLRSLKKCTSVLYRRFLKKRENSGEGGRTGGESPWEGGGGGGGSPKGQTRGGLGGRLRWGGGSGLLLSLEIKCLKRGHETLGPA